MHSEKVDSKRRTIAELGGEIWAELEMRLGVMSAKPVLPDGLPNEISEIIMGILARHIGRTIVADPVVPVEPLKPLFKPET